MGMMFMEAIVLAGGKEKKALKLLEGKPILSYVLDAFLSSRYIDKIFVVGDGLPLPESEKIVSIPEGKDFIDNLLRGMERCQGEYVLVSSADLPFLTPTTIDKFIEKALPLKADFAYPTVSKEVFQRKAPDIDKTFVVLKEGKFAGGNVVLLNREFVLKKRDVIEKAYEVRKSPLKIAFFLGFEFFIRFLLQQVGIPALTLSQVERLMSRALKGKIRSVLVDFPHLSADIDDEKDFQWALERLKNTPPILE
ncbi:MAG: NTP transferase domain-containing protein [bacterium]